MWQREQAEEKGIQNEDYVELETQVTTLFHQVETSNLLSSNPNNPQAQLAKASEAKDRERKERLDQLKVRQTSLHNQEAVILLVLR